MRGALTAAHGPPGGGGSTYELGTQAAVPAGTGLEAPVRVEHARSRDKMGAGDTTRGPGAAHLPAPGKMKRQGERAGEKNK